MSHVPGSVRECEGIGPHIPKGTPTLGIGVLVDFQMFIEWLQGSKPNGLKSSLYHLKILKHRCLKWSCIIHLDIWNTSYGQKKAGNQIDSLIPDHWKSGIDSIWHIVGKLLTRATTLLQTSSQSDVCMQSCGPPKSWESQLWQFWDSHLGVSRQNVIWMWASWRGVEYTIRKKVLASSKSELWWVLWVRVARGLS
jgi:hypothetical protein